jgi:glycosyltransferase involved in cell wall biosynthesis
MNSEYKNTVFNYNAKKINWEERSPHPELLKVNNLDELMASPRLFARKFDTDIDHVILDKLEVYIKNDITHPQKNKKIPQISVVMSVYNAKRFLQEVVDSILRQTFTDFELIIVDNGSTDDSVEIIKKYKDNRIKLVLNEHDYIDSLNLGLSYAKGRYIARMNPDGLMSSDRLEIQYEFMEKNPETGICIGRKECPESCEESEKIPTDHNKIANKLIYGNFAIHPTIMFRRKPFKKKKIQYKKGYPHAEEYKLWTDIIKAGFQFAGIQKVLHYERKDKTPICRDHYNEMMQEIFKIQMEYIEYSMNMIVKKDERYYKLINSIIKASNDNLIDIESFTDMIGRIHDTFLKNALLVK